MHLELILLAGLTTIMAATGHSQAVPEPEVRPVFCTVRWEMDERRRRLDPFYLLCPRSVPEPDALQAYADSVMSALPSPLPLQFQRGLTPIDYVPFNWTESGWTMVEPAVIVQAIPRITRPQEVEGRCDYTVMIGRRGEARQIDVQCQGFDREGVAHRANDYVRSVRSALQQFRWVHDPSDPAPCISYHHVFRLAGSNRGPERAQWLLSPVEGAPSCPQRDREKPVLLPVTFNTSATSDAASEAASAVCRTRWVAAPDQRQRIVSLSLACPATVQDADALQAYADSLVGRLPIPLTVAFDRGADVVSEIHFARTPEGWRLEEPTTIIDSPAIATRETLQSGRQGRCDFAGVIADDGRLNPVQIECGSFRTSGEPLSGDRYLAVMSETIPLWYWIYDPAIHSGCVVDRYRFLNDGFGDVPWMENAPANAPTCPMSAAARE